MGDLASDALDSLVRANAGAIQDAIPPLEIPVQIELLGSTKLYSREGETLILVSNDGTLLYRP